MFGRILIVYLLLANVIAFAMYGIDKRKAMKDQWRIPEKTLLLAALIGGSFGAFVGMQVFHHKTKHWKFIFGVPACMILHVALGVLYWWYFLL
ncbi:MAG: DUF1294 domain-containing protein [Lachnospiraceae bacterium]|nr:DUF1294 domain-containing protein [Lachnospiraceae bacterium]